ncbi:MAG: hypothetical protein GXX98_01560 [Planctomycetes bacterium]|jgi:hypothetical protein|nr:hypothetical protein [Planctomycetota bacterium]
MANENLSREEQIVLGEWARAQNSTEQHLRTGWTIACMMVVSSMLLFGLTGLTFSQAMKDEDGSQLQIVILGAMGIASCILAILVVWRSTTEAKLKSKTCRAIKEKLCSVPAQEERPHPPRFTVGCLVVLLSIATIAAWILAILAVTTMAEGPYRTMR